MYAGAIAKRSNIAQLILTPLCFIIQSSMRVALMNELNFEDIEKMDCEGRYEVFLGLVANEREIWVLINDNNEFLKIHSEDEDIEYLPVWPHADFVASYLQGSDEKLIAKNISVPEFFAKWIPGLDRDGLKVGVFPMKDIDVWILDPHELKSDLQDEFSNFGF